MGNDYQRNKNSVIELIRLFLKLGTIAFGGPAAHIAMMEEEVVRRRKWITREHFLDLVGATNLIPGPNSTEMAIHIGYIRGGFLGLIVSGLSFILPAVIITGLLAWVYMSFGSIPQVTPFLFGIKPAVISVILVAVIRLGRTAAKNTLLMLIGIAVAAASLLGMNEILALLSGGVIGIILYRMKGHGSKKVSGWMIPLLSQSLGLLKSSDAKAAVAVSAAGIAGVSLWKLGLFFLKVGSVLYGSGYVLIAFLEGGLVKDYGWLTQQQLLDAIAVGQFTPGPVLSTATFVGYVVSGVPGAMISTAAIFLPSFIFVLILNPVIPRLRASKIMSAFLDAVNISAIGLMAAVVIQLASAALTDWRAILIALATTIAGIRFKINAAWLVAGGAVAGWVLQIVFR
ncbi:MAG: chromate efflux transporter [Nitrospirae bacterium]|nr:chromate efflux transporter [Nitrospirota bacterium]